MNTDFNSNNSKIVLHQQNIPQELIALSQWVAWEGKENGNGKLSKKPINPKTGTNAKTNHSDTWGTFEQALACCQSNNLQGIGFVFSENDRYVGIDLDKCRDPGTGEFKSQAKEIIDLFNSYTEISPSGNGAHILVKGSLPAGGRKTKRWRSTTVHVFLRSPGTTLVALHRPSPTGTVR